MKNKTKGHYIQPSDYYFTCMVKCTLNVSAWNKQTGLSINSVAQSGPKGPMRKEEQLTAMLCIFIFKQMIALI